MVALVAWASYQEQAGRPAPYNGDSLGRNTSESMDSYLTRAGQSLDRAPADEKAFALVTFTDPLPTAAAGPVFESVGIGRVNALIVDAAAPIALPEPVEPDNRAVVFDRALKRMAGTVGAPPASSDFWIRGAVVRDTGTKLRELAASSPEILAVEVLPPDAAWGLFGVQPVVTGR
nr:hypothetical protein [Corynebacterium mendelii]